MSCHFLPVITTIPTTPTASNASIDGFAIIVDIISVDDVVVTSGYWYEGFTDDVTSYDDVTDPADDVSVHP